MCHRHAAKSPPVAALLSRALKGIEQRFGKQRLRTHRFGGKTCAGRGTAMRLRYGRYAGDCQSRRMNGRAPAGVVGRDATMHRMRVEGGMCLANIHSLPNAFTLTEGKTPLTILLRTRVSPGAPPALRSECPAQ